MPLLKKKNNLPSVRDSIYRTEKVPTGKVVFTIEPFYLKKKKRGKIKDLILLFMLSNCGERKKTSRLWLLKASLVEVRQ